MCQHTWHIIDKRKKHVWLGRARKTECLVPNIAYIGNEDQAKTKIWVETFRHFITVMTENVKVAMD